MSKGSYQAPLIIAIIGLMISLAFTGGVFVVDPLSVVHPTCTDQINNDNDGGILNFFDTTDRECTWMPMYFGQGEYDGQGFGNPPLPDVSAYAVQWASITDPLPTHFEVVKAWYENAQVNVCTPELQDSLIHYRDVELLPDSKTGVSQHQAFCGVSY